MPENVNVSDLKHNQAKITMNQVSVPEDDNYFYGYYILFKNLDDPNSSWRAEVMRNNVPPLAKRLSLTPYTNYSVRVSAASFKSAGLISEVVARFRTPQHGM